MNFRYVIKKKIKHCSLYFCNLERHVLIAGFPKTGNTYVHYLINNLLKIGSEVQPEYSYVSSYIKSPDLDMIPIYKLNPILNTFNKQPLLLKTHNEYHSSFQRVICLVRNPVSTFVSLYNYELTFYENSYKNFKSFLLKRDVINQYKNFYKSYLNAKLSSRIVFLNYEDAIKNAQVLKDIIFLIYGVNLDLKYIKEIMQACSKKRALDIEELYIKYDKRNKLRGKIFVNNKNFLNKPKDEDIKFINTKLNSFYEILK